MRVLVLIMFERKRGRVLRIFLSIELFIYTDTGVAICASDSTGYNSGSHDASYSKTAFQSTRYLKCKVSSFYFYFVSINFDCAEKYDVSYHHVCLSKIEL